MNELHSNSADYELSQLLAGLVDQCLTSAQFDRLDERLRTEPEARRRYLDYIEMHDELAEIVLAIDDPNTVEPAATAISATSHKSKPFPIRTLAIAGGLAATLLIAATLFLLPENEQVSSRERPEAAPVAEAAQADVRFANLARARFFGELAPALHSVPTIDRDYVLIGGMVELAFPKGARAIIEAPAVFRVKSEESLALHVGNCSVHAPKGAEGFHVETPAACVVDRGTRFSLSVSETNVTEVQVIEGAADVYRRAGDADGPSEKTFEARLERNEAQRYGYATEAAAEPIPFNSDAYQYSLPDRIVSYEASKPEGRGAKDLVSVTVQRGGRQYKVPASELIPSEVTWFRASSGLGILAGEQQLPADRTQTLNDHSLITGVINPGGSRMPLETSPILSDDESGTPGMAVRFQQPVENGPGPDVVFFELQGQVNPATGDRFHVSPLDFKAGLKSHTVEIFDLTMESPQALELVDFYVHMFKKPPLSLEQLQTIECVPVLQAVKFRALAVGIDLSDLGYQPGECVDGLFFQDALDDKHAVDPVFIGGLLPVPDR